MSQRSEPLWDAVQGRAPLHRVAATLGSEKDPPPVTGELTTDPAALSATADDFGHVIHRTPQYVLKPASVADISAVVTWAASQGLKVAARGQGHSNYGRPMVQGGVVIDI
ncbi:MAG TPA: FAD-binding protein, partial [Streptosporangiaceae bacterium]|nr:FAD-binding protein [Streptosporangiaceae bacterium]